MKGLCQYRHLLGVEGKGPHAYRLGGIAVVDVALTLVAAGVICYFSGWSFWVILLSLFLLGIVLHRLFCVKTTVDKWLFG